MKYLYTLVIISIIILIAGMAFGMANTCSDAKTFNGEKDVCEQALSTGGVKAAEAKLAYFKNGASPSGIEHGILTDLNLNETLKTAVELKNTIKGLL